MSRETHPITIAEVQWVESMTDRNELEGACIRVHSHGFRERFSYVRSDDRNFGIVFGYNRSECARIAISWKAPFVVVDLTSKIKESTPGVAPADSITTSGA